MRQRLICVVRKPSDRQHPCLQGGFHCARQQFLWPCCTQARQKEDLQLAIGRATSAPVDEVKLRKSAEIAEAGSQVSHPTD